MGTRCRGLGEILARLTGHVLGQIVTRVQITERMPSIPQNHAAPHRLCLRDPKVAAMGLPSGMVLSAE